MGRLGTPSFWLLLMEQFEKFWQHDEQGRRTYTTLRLQNPIMDGIRRFGLHPPQEETLPDEQGTVDMTSFRDALIALLRNQTVDEQGHRDEITVNVLEYVDDYVSISSGSLSPDLGEMWMVRVSKKSGLGQMVMLMRRLRRKRCANVLRGTCVTCWRDLFGHQYVPSWCRTMFHVFARQLGSGMLQGCTGPLPNSTFSRTFFLHIALDELWKLQKILSSKKGSLSQTYKKNTETNAKVYDLNLKTMRCRP